MAEAASRPPRKLLGRAERAASIRRAAARAFARAGFAATSIEDIATEAGVTKIIIYRHYDTKRQIYQAVLDDTRREIGARAGGDSIGPDGLRALLRQARADPAGFVLLFRHAAREPEFADYAGEFATSAAEYAETELADRVADPTLRRWLATTIFDLTVDSIQHWIQVGEADRDDEAANRLLSAIDGFITGITDR